jgi:iron(III) transport system permease protein
MTAGMRVEEAESESKSDFRRTSGGGRPSRRRQPVWVTKFFGRDRDLRRMMLVSMFALGVITVFPMVWLARWSVRDPEGGVTLQFYYQLVTSLGPLEATKNSIIFAGWSIVIGLTLALVAAISTSRLNVPGARLVRTISAVAFVNPPWITAMAYGYLLSPQAGTLNVWMDRLFGIKPFNAYSMITMCIVGGLFLYPYMYLVIAAALRNMDSSYEEAARTSGASPITTLRKVTIPLVTPSIVTSIVFSVVILWGSFAVPAILGTPANIYVFATYLYNLLRAFPPQLELTAAIAVFFAVFAGLMVTVVLKLVRGRYGGKFRVVGGKGHRSVILKTSPRLRWFLAAINLITVSLALVIPYAVILRLSFAENIYQPLGLSNVSLRYFEWNLTHASFWQVVSNTLQTSAVVAIVGGALAVVVAYVDMRGKGRLKQILSPLATFPIAVPAITLVVGVAVGWLQSPITIYGTIWIITVCQIARFLPLGMQTMTDGITQLHPDLEDAARTCGASTRTILRSIALPIMKPVAVAAFLLLWMAAMRDLLTPLFLGTGTAQTATLSSRVFNLWSEGQVAASSALAIILIVLMGVLYFFLSLLLDSRARRGRKRRLASTSEA